MQCLLEGLLQPVGASSVWVSGVGKLEAGEGSEGQGIGSLVSTGTATGHLIFCMVGLGPGGQGRRGLGLAGKQRGCIQQLGEGAGLWMCSTRDTWAQEDGSGVCGEWEEGSIQAPEAEGVIEVRAEDLVWGGECGDWFPKAGRPGGWLLDQSGLGSDN